MRLVSLMLTLALLPVHTLTVAQTDPLGRKLVQTKPPPPDTGWTGIQQVGRIAKPPTPQPAASTPPVAVDPRSGCADSNSAAGASSLGCSSASSNPTGPRSSTPSTGTYQQLQIGKIDFATEPDPSLNQAIKAAIVNGATGKAGKPPANATAQATQRPSGAAPKAPYGPPNPNYVPPQR